jgi:KipI family sensor histidine kinase inhibitor
MQILPMGPNAVLVEDPPGGPAAWSRGLLELDPDGLVDVVPAATTVLIRVARAEQLQQVVDLLVTVRAVAPDRTACVVTIPVRYDGPDLADVAAATGLQVDDVVELHCGAVYEVAFCGFAPGFGYLSGLPERLHLPRRATPRTSVAAGSVAIAAGYAAVYPGASPGGWHVLGRTSLVLFDPDGDPPALLSPGTCVRFEPT